MTGPATTKTPRKRYPSDDGMGRSLAFRDPGPPCGDPDWKPRTLWSKRTPEQAMAAAFVRLGRDYGGWLPGAIEKRTASRQRAKAWYWANRERVWARAAKWKLEHPDRYRQLVREGTRRYRARKKAAARGEVEGAPV